MRGLRDIVEVLHVGGGELVLLRGQPMNLLVAETRLMRQREKHVPVIEKVSDGYQGQDRFSRTSDGRKTLY